MNVASIFRLIDRYGIAAILRRPGYEPATVRAHLSSSAAPEQFSGDRHQRVGTLWVAASDPGLAGFGVPPKEGDTVDYLGRSGVTVVGVTELATGDARTLYVLSVRG